MDEEDEEEDAGEGRRILPIVVRSSSRRLQCGDFLKVEIVLSCFSSSFVIDIALYVLSVSVLE
jgi:hypothetical protein